MINRHIEIVRSSKAGLSSMGQASCDSILAVLAKHYRTVGVTTVNNLADLESLANLKPNLVFLGMKYIPAREKAHSSDPDKIWIAQFLDQHSIAYTGSGQMAHELEFDKALAKSRVDAAGLRTSAFYVIKHDQLSDLNFMPLNFPLFVKPTNRGGGLGIDSKSVVRNFDELRAKVYSLASELRSDSLIEEYLPGREFSVAILKAEQSGRLSVMPIELIAQPDERGARLLSGEVKSSNSEQAVEVWDEPTESVVKHLALEVFRTLGARDYGRIDIRLDKDGVPHFLEANLLPSLVAGYGSFPKACSLKTNLGHEAMILRITKLGLARFTDTIEASQELAVADHVFPGSLETVFRPA